VFEIDDFILPLEFSTVELLLDLPARFYRKVGQHEAVIMVGEQRHYSKIVIQDTTPPDAEPRNVRIFMGERSDIENFFTVNEEEIDYDEEEDSEESSEEGFEEYEPEIITAEFVTPPDWELEGTQTVAVRVSDECGNYTIVESELTILVDTTPPQIHGARDIRVLVNTTVSFRSGITVTDDLDYAPQLTVDSSAVNTNRIGVYPVTYTARDRAGNTSSVTVNVHVTGVTVDDLNRIADDRLRNIGAFRTESLPERARLIHNYVRSTMIYVRAIGPGGHSDEHFAYTTLRTMRGNCIATQRVSEVLLNRAGIENMRISNVEATHVWNLIKIDGLWYHYDATWFNDCRYAGSYMFTQETALRISPNRKNRYDEIKWDDYPEVVQN
jgi:hypothetical protein